MSRKNTQRPPSRRRRVSPNDELRKVNMKMVARDALRPVAAAWQRAVWILGSCAALSFASATDAQVRSAPGVAYWPAKAESQALPFLKGDLPSREVRLSRPTSAEPNAMTKAQIRRDKDRPLRIGFERAPPSADRSTALSELAWQSQPDGSLVAQIKVTSPTAAGVRLHMQLRSGASGVEMRLAGTRGNGQVFAANASDLALPDGYWSPVLEGETALVQLRVSAAESPQGVLDLLDVGHLVLAASELKIAEDIGTSGLCEQDVVCVADPAVTSVAQAVAQTVLSDGGFEVLCTSTLLNTVPQSNIPYLMAASHCFDQDRNRSDQEVQVVASTMTTYWFFDAVTCGSNVPGSYVQVPGGATLLYRAADLDFALFRMNANPPVGAWFSAWDATPVTTATQAIVLHHPEGDLKKLSSGTTQGYGPFNGAGSFIEMRYLTGSTEPGSSGAPLLTCTSRSANGVCNAFSVRGALIGGDSACSNPSGIDFYSRLDLAYPYVASYLAPGTVLPSGQGTAVEFYNVDLDHFFITADAVEQNGIDNGSAGPGWHRTGYGFKTLQSGGGAPVCRFYGSVWPGPNSHFYTLDQGECQYLKRLQGVQPATQPRWNYEGIAFSSLVATAAGCPAGTSPVYRYYNNGFPFKDSNHRFVTSLGPHDFMIDQGWVLEGVAMCSPS